MAGNQQGKTVAGGMEMAMHLTGLYPSWWEGRRFNKPIVGWAAGVTAESTRDNPQRVLMGYDEPWGTGTIPASCIIKVTKAKSISEALDTVLVKSKFGVSRLRFKAYEQGYRKWQGPPVDVVWYDEEPEEDIYSEGLSRTNKTKGINYLTFTPLEGITSVVNYFWPEPDNKDRALVHMQIDDAEHFDDEQKRKVIAGYRPHEREARVKGIPMLGSGRIFTVPEEDLMEEPFDVPRAWAQIGGIDFGYDHPTALVWLAWDRDNDRVHVTNAYRKSEKTPIYHATAMKSRGTEIPWAWPHDGYAHDKQSGRPLAEAYRRLGVRMLAKHATFPDGSYGVEAGLMEMLDRMETGRFRVSKHLMEWFDEYRTYHRKEGRIVKVRDDLMCATRYAHMMLRFARAGTNLLPEPTNTWDDGYDPMNPTGYTPPPRPRSFRRAS